MNKKPAIATAETDALISKFVDCYRRHDIDGMVSMFAPDVEMIDPAYPFDLKQVSNFRFQYERLFRAFPDMDMEVTHKVVEDNKAFIAVMTLGHGKGELDGRSVEGRVSNPREGVLFEINDQSLISYFEFFSDTALLNYQLGRPGKWGTNNT
jgi:predicted ester cyclase